jgi:hypothetical protein
VPYVDDGAGQAAGGVQGQDGRVGGIKARQIKRFEGDLGQPLPVAARGEDGVGPQEAALLAGGPADPEKGKQVGGGEGG